MMAAARIKDIELPSGDDREPLRIAHKRENFGLRRQRRRSKFGKSENQKKKDWQRQCKQDQRWLRYQLSRKNWGGLRLRTAQILGALLKGEDKEEQDRFSVHATPSIEDPDMHQAWVAWEKLKSERAKALELGGGGSWAEDWWDPTYLSMESDNYDEEGSRDKADERDKGKEEEKGKEGEERERERPEEPEHAGYQGAMEGFMDIDEEDDEELGGGVELGSAWGDLDWGAPEPVTP